MKAAVVHAWGGPGQLSVESVPDPIPTAERCWSGSALPR